VARERDGSWGLMASTKRTRKATKRSAENDKPRERARAAEALVKILEAKIQRAEYVKGYLRGSLEIAVGRERSAEILTSAILAATAATPVSAEERRIDELPF